MTFFNFEECCKCTFKTVCGSGMFIPDPDLNFLPIPDPGINKAPDPGSATLLQKVISKKLR
jgi:hypothetical protein